MTNQVDTNPPTGTKRIMRVADLPALRSPARYELRFENGKSQTLTLDKRKRQIVDLLIGSPVYCASPVRLSDIVHILKREVGLEIETKYYPGNPSIGAGDYGVYFLVSDIRPLKGCGVAA